MNPTFVWGLFFDMFRIITPEQVSRNKPKDN